MSTYRVATGHSVALGSLAVLSPQPRNGEVHSLRTYGDTGAQERAEWCAFVWDVLETEEQYQDILTAFGLLDATTSKVTIYTRSPVFNWVRYNGIAIQPEIGVDGSWDRYFARNFTIHVRNLEALVEP
jgi:hypothetical protein